MANTTFIRVKDMDSAIWEYIKIVSARKGKSIPAILKEMAELHAISTNRTLLLNTLKEEYDGKYEDRQA